ncbi:MAG: AMP-binding protein, partial [Pseudomonadota bacterium]
MKTSFGIVGHWAAETPDRVFLTQPLNGQVKTWTYAQAYDAARRLAQWFLGQGIEPGDKVALLSKNCAEWVITDLALAMSGIVSVPIYPTASAPTIKYVLEHSDARMLVIGRLDNPGVAEEAVAAKMPTVTMRYDSIDGAHDWDKAVADSARLADPHAPAPRETMTMLYTSGSTGRPKGVVMSYGAYAYACGTCTEIYGCSREERLLSYLPLAHVAERTASAGPVIFGGGQLFFVDALETFVDDLKRANATVFTSVPRLWVQFQTGVHKGMPPEKLDRLLSISILGKMVARKIRQKLGLDNARLHGSGSAPISPATLRWYERLGIQISEGWGMTETGGLSCTNLPFRSDRVGSIGKPIPGTDMRLSDEGEIELKSPGLMTEYYKNPEATAETMTDDGYLKTGDKGEWDASI